MSSKKLITVVCTGNTCRSPMAAKLLEHALKAEPKPLCEFEVVSAGVAAYSGDPASENSVRALRKVGIDLNDHRSRRVTPQLLDQSALVLTMTEQHRDAILRMDPEITAPVHLFREWMEPEDDASIPDPIGGTLTEYVETRDSIADAIPSILNYLRKEFIS